MLAAVRPALKSGLLPIWRDRDTVQIGIDPRRAVALTGMAGAARVIGLLDGSRDRAQLVEAAAECGIPAPLTDKILTLLAAAGVLDDFPAGTLRALGQPVPAGLAAQLATVSLARRDSDGGARSLARRRAALVRVHGGGPVGAAIAGLLSAAGVGRVSAGPGPAGDLLPDLALIAGQPGPELTAALMRAGTPHLSAAAAEAIGAVGPLVLPGRTACLGCLHQARTDRDPAWPVIAAQLAGREPVPAACDAPLAAAVAAQASFQALAFIDGAGIPAAVTNATLELVLPGWQWRRRTWPPHPACDCGSDRAR
jgi:hypothetical protein